MAIPHISRTAVLAAVEEHDRLGETAFMQKYGFGEPRGYYVQHGGKRYGAKAIIGAARGHEYPELGPLTWRDFSGGKSTASLFCGGSGLTFSNRTAASRV